MIGLNAPFPRLRIYTTAGQYVQTAAAMLTGKAGAGKDVEQLEREMGRRLDVEHAIATPMARVAIYLALKHLIRPGQEVILSPYTIADVINMVVCAGGRPVFADIDRKTCNISADEVEKLIGPQTGAVMVTHFYGMMADVERIGEICERHNVPMIEDAAQAFGASLNGRPAGTFGRAGIYSFGMYKNVNSFLGGMIVTGDGDLAQAIRNTVAEWPFFSSRLFAEKLASAAMTDAITLPVVFRSAAFWLFRYAFLNEIDRINNRLKIDLSPEMKRELPKSYAGRMMPIQARLILGQLDGVQAQTKKRVQAARIYSEGLRDIDELILPPERYDGSHMYWYYPIQYRDRHKLVGYAMRHFRDITESYHRNCAALPCFAEFARACPNAQATADSLIYLPTYPRYPEREIRKTVEVIRSFFGRSDAKRAAGR